MKRCDRNHDGQAFHMRGHEVGERWVAYSRQPVSLRIFSFALERGYSAWERERGNEILWWNREEAWGELDQRTRRERAEKPRMLWIGSFSPFCFSSLAFLTSLYVSTLCHLNPFAASHISVASFYVPRSFGHMCYSFLHFPPAPLPIVVCYQSSWSVVQVVYPLLKCWHLPIYMESIPADWSFQYHCENVQSCTVPALVQISSVFLSCGVIKPYLQHFHYIH